jgi:hypothetical protein
MAREHATPRRELADSLVRSWRRLSSSAATKCAAADAAPVGEGDLPLQVVEVDQVFRIRQAGEQLPRLSAAFPGRCNEPLAEEDLGHRRRRDRGVAVLPQFTRPPTVGEKVLDRLRLAACLIGGRPEYVDEPGREHRVPRPVGQLNPLTA